MLNERRSKKLARDLYDFLNENNLFIETPNFDCEIEWLIKGRSNAQGYFIQDIIAFLEKRYYSSKLPKHIEEELETMKYALLTNHALSQYEILKRTFYFALNFKKIDRKVTTKTPYGIMIRHLSGKGLKKCVVKALDNDLRNVIAHDSWYVKNFKFMYFKNKNWQSMSSSELASRIINFIILGQEFFTLYWNDDTMEHCMEFADQKKIEKRFRPETLHDLMSVDLLNNNHM